MLFMDYGLKISKRINNSFWLVKLPKWIINALFMNKGLIMNYVLIGLIILIKEWLSKDS